MRHAYIVTYDISDPKRLKRVYKAMLGFGDHIQLSVFRCELNQRELVELRATLGALIHSDADQILIASLGPVDGRAQVAIQSLGRPYDDPERLAVVV